jgi:hypothetical protein
MEILIDIISFSLFVGLILCPILLLRQINKTKIKFKFITYLTLGLILTAIITFVFAWWTDTSDLILLRHFGYNIDGMNETEFYGKVLPENMDKVKRMEKSIMGIGWPLKAFLTFIYYSPYIFIVYFIVYLIGKKKLNKIKILQDS